jgi:hypothetical protein
MYAASRAQPRQGYAVFTLHLSTTPHFRTQLQKKILTGKKLQTKLHHITRHITSQPPASSSIEDHLEWTSSIQTLLQCRTMVGLSFKQERKPH